MLSLAACSASESPHAIRFALSTAPVSLDPRHATDATSARLNRLLYARLVDFDAQSRVVPALAHWQQLDTQHYRFVLHDRYRHFHNGQTLQATDVAATYAYVLDAANGSPYRAPLAHISRIEVLDNDTIDFYLDRPDALFVERLTIGVMPAELIAQGHDFHRQPIGSGAFRFVAHNGAGDISLERIADRQQFRFLEVRDPTVRVLKLLRGEVDMLQNDVAPELINWLADREGIRLQRRHGSNFSYLGINHAEPALSDRRVREAIACAIDRQQLIRYLLADGARPAQSLLPPEHWAGHPDLPKQHCTAREASALLRQAGYDAHNKPRLVYKTSTDPLRVRLATVVREQLNSAGFDVQVQSLDWGTFYADIKSGNFELYSLTWVGIRSPDSFEYIFHSRSLPPAGANRGRYVNQQADTLIDTALAQTNVKAMLPSLLALQQLLNEDLVYVPLWYEDHVVAMREQLTGYMLSADGNYDGLANVSLRDSGQSLAAHATGMMD
ncbi:MAG: ABC transporter substrate-binding protein [Granulosicoccaceae bacterium]|jgi:peptide/nickel transport system substrate-binding protein